MCRRKLGTSVIAVPPAQEAQVPPSPSRLRGSWPPQDGAPLIVLGQEAAQLLQLHYADLVYFPLYQLKIT